MCLIFDLDPDPEKNMQPGLDYIINLKTEWQPSLDILHYFELFTLGIGY